MTTRSICFGLPSYDRPDPAFTRALQDTETALTKMGIAHARAELSGESMITRARNRITATFLRTNLTDLLWIDNDIAFKPSDVLRLIHSGHQFCAAPYPAKAPGGMLIGNPVEIEGGHHIVVKDGWCLARDLPTGFMLITRAALERIAPHVPEVDDDLPGSTLGSYRVFFDGGVDGRQYLSEDWWFSRLAHKCGIEGWLDTRATLGHIGRFEFRAPSLEEKWAVGAVAT